MNTMQETMIKLCESIQGCKLGYTQSDEITLLLTDYDTLTTDAWFDYNIQKLCSVSASLTTLQFNDIFITEINSSYKSNLELEYFKNMCRKINKALFDSRCFNIPKEEVCNCFIWRQQDATRNAIQLLGQHYFSQKQLHQKSCNDIQDMLMENFNVNFNDERSDFKRGSCCYKNELGEWVLDKEIPIFAQDREFIGKWV